MKWILELRKPFMITLTLLFICGVIYPAAMTGLSSLLFPKQAAGSLVYAGGEAVGARYVGQAFTDPRFMQGRPSAVNYNTYTEEQKSSGEYGGVASGSSNYGPSNPDLTARVAADMESFLSENPGVTAADIPADLMTASGSGLDPHISPAAAEIQILRLAKNSGLSAAQLRQIIEDNTEHKVLGVFGEEAVNVLGVNLDIYHYLTEMGRWS